MNVFVVLNTKEDILKNVGNRAVLDHSIFFFLLWKSIAAFPSTCFYAHFGISHKKTLDGNAKMCINSKNAHKKRMRTFE